MQYNSNKPMSLPPGMARHYAARAAAGDFDYYIGSGIYIWFKGNQKTVLIGGDRPVGHIVHLTTAQVAAERTSAAASAASYELRQAKMTPGETS